MWSAGPCGLEAITIHTHQPPSYLETRVLPIAVQGFLPPASFVQPGPKCREGLDVARQLWSGVTEVQLAAMMAGLGAAVDALLGSCWWGVGKALRVMGPAFAPLARGH